MSGWRLRLAFGVALLSAGASLHSLQLSRIAPPEIVSFAAIGDMGTGKKPQFELAAAMVAARARTPFDFAIMLGDNIYGGKSAGDFRNKFELPYKMLLDDGVKFYASLGNHDNRNQRLYKPFNMGGEIYYTFRKGNAQFFALDSNYMSPQQLAWLEKELRESKADWKIPYFHHPLYSSAEFHGSAVELRLVLEPLFVKYGVQVVFAGHEHVYERAKPQVGIVHFIEGASGQLRKGNLRKRSALTAAGYDRDLSFMLVEIIGERLNFRAIARTGETVDAGTIVLVPAAAD
jgi:hypothetical protein